MDFAPGGGDVAPGSAAFAVAKGDRPALLRSGATFWRSEFDDAAPVVEHNALSSAVAGVLLDDSHRHGNIETTNVANTTAGTAVGIKVALPNTDHDDRGSAAHHRRFCTASGYVDDAGKDVVTFLVAGARVVFTVVVGEFFLVEE